LAIQNNSKATKEHIDQVHSYLDAAELQYAVNEEELRPAFANLVRATNDVTKSQELLEVALDVSAGTGKSLDVVTQAMGRALNGSTTALNRLVPALKNSKNPMDDLAAAFKGAADEAAKQKSWERFQLIIDRITDDIGHLLLPILEKFAAWFTETYPKVQAFFKNLMSAFNNPGVKKAFSELGQALGSLGTSLARLFGLPKSAGAQDMVTFLKTLAQALTLVAKAADAVVKSLKIAFPLLRFPDLTKNLGQFLVDTVPRPNTITPGRISTPGGSGSNVNINITNRLPSPSEVIQKIKEAERQTGKKYLR
jgi:hypothetical protein